MNPTPARTSFLVLAFAALLGGCFSDRPTEPEGPPSFSEDIQPVFSGSCAFSGCHGDNANPAQKPMALLAGQAYDNIVGVSSAELPGMDRIEPGEPDESYLIHKIQGTQGTVGGSGDRMPLGSAPLAPSTIELIRQWVEDGAPRN